MFGNNKEGNDNKSVRGASSSFNNISKGTLIEGTVSSENNFRIDGTIKGLVKTKAKLAVGSSGLIDGEVYCQNADIEGRVIGKIIVTELLFIRANAQVEGEIVTAKLVVESGARFNGTCSMGVKAIQNAEKITHHSLKSKEAV